MKRLILLRHAHAEPKNPAAADLDRSLSADGRAAAARMGEYLASEGLMPEQIFCSEARRARETLEYLASGWGVAPPTRFDRTLYQATSGGILAVLKTAEETVGTALVIGHNPAIEELARQLASEGNRDAMRRMATSFPAGSLAVFEIAEDGWHGFGAGEVWLRRFVCPRDLEQEGPG